MDIGIGTPNTALGVTGEVLNSWAARGDELGFSSLATIGRVAYPSYDELVTLSAAAGATSRIRLMTDVLLAPIFNGVLLARATASLDRISGGRLTLGLGVGSRPDDYALAGVPFEERGRIFDEHLRLLHQTWRGFIPDDLDEPFSPGAETGTIPVLIAGDPVRAGKRAARWKAGFTIGGAPVETARDKVEAFRASYAEAGGTEEPRVVALTYFSLGKDALEESLHNLSNYYAFTGERAEGIAQGAARDEDEIKRRIEGFAAAGVDELIFHPTVGVTKQVDRLANIVFA
jgi:alkanesulfonate monooxygenase SsuD/methylene tetrahydromethanopterin reductase-like flavin-dependent oxidoreductase (luciferase family)